MLTKLSLKKLIADALTKDQGRLGDVTTLAVVDSGKKATAELVVKADKGIVSGLKVFKLVFEVMDPNIKVGFLKRDGDSVAKGDVIATIRGKAQSILTGERVALEFIRRMSGIATKTNEFVKQVKGTKTKILDTRKIMPCFGELDKQAVVDGGGVNHRKDLSEMGLIKNNHIDLVGGVKQAVSKFRSKYPHIPIEVEVRNVKELRDALNLNVDRVMLDNMTSEQMIEAVNLRNKLAKDIPLEASGNMSLKRVKSVAKTGVEFISVGALTHSVGAFDLSLHITIHK